MYKAQTDYHHSIYFLLDKPFNDIHPLFLLTLNTNKDILYYYEAIKAKDTDYFKAVIKDEILSF